jgi:hypothetical protein
VSKSNTPESVATSRRNMIGLGLGAALPAARTAAAVAPHRTSGKPPERAIAKRPYAQGGPVDRDQSVASTVATGATEIPVGKQYATYAEAIRASHPLSSSLFVAADRKAHLLRRATFGARPADLAAINKLGISEWLHRQLHPSLIPDPDGDAAWLAFPLAGATPAKVIKSIDKYSWDAMFQTAQATLGRQIFSQRQLFEVVADVFASHLHVAVPSEQWHTAPDYIKNVIRKHAFGNYRDMLLAAMKHPAMLTFLSNDQSYKAHVNENLGREMLELHTVGVASGYTENDVKASAAIMSGRTIDYDKGTYVYDATRHATGPVAVLGFHSANATGAGGQAVGDAYVRYLATHPATARNIARKIATRFVSDQPSENLIQRLANIYLAHDTNILAVVNAVFLSSDFWSAVGVRMRRPLEDCVGAARVLNVTRATTSKNTAAGIVSLYWNLYEAGNAPLGWNPPNGYPDVAAAWLGAGSMIQRWNTHRALVYGWWGGFRYVKPLSLVKIPKGMTAEQWVNAVAVRLVGKTPTAPHRAALLAAMSLKPTDPPPGWDYLGGEAISLVLDSAYFQLR